MRTRVKHVSIGFPTTPFVKVLELSSLNSGFDFIFLPKYWGAEPFGVINKVMIMKAWLDSGGAGHGEIVMFTDAYDTLVVEDSSEIARKFYSREVDLIFSGESHFWPPDGREELRSAFEVNLDKWRYLNSGGFIGYAWAIKEFVSFCVESIKSGELGYHKPDDQALAQLFFLNQKRMGTVRLAIDTRAEIFASLNTSVEDYEVQKSFIVHAKTFKCPSVIHANANKENMAILTRYWNMTSPTDGLTRTTDLRIGMISEKYLTYSKLTKRLSGEDHISEELLIFSVKGDSLSVAFLLSGELLTFLGDGTINSNASRIAAWEILHHRSTVETYHGRTIGAYLESAETSASIQLCSIPLQLLLHPCFERLVGQVHTYSSTF